MKNLGLKSRIALVGLLPLICFIALEVYAIYTDYTIRKETQKLEMDLSLIFAASELVHETQKERGISAAFLSGGTQRENVLKQHERVNEKKDALISVLAKESADSPLAIKTDETIKNYDSFRNGVLNKSVSVGAAVKNYTGIVSNLLSLQTDLARQTTVTEIATSLNSLRVIEEAKESGGKLRAVVSSVLGSNQPITEAKVLQITNLFAGVQASVSSKVLKLTPEMQDVVKKFQTSQEWQYVEKMVVNVAKKSSEGNFGDTADNYFATITSALNIVNELVGKQKDVVRNEVMKAQSSSVNSLVLDVVLSLVVSLFVVIFVVRTTRSISNSINLVADDLKKGSKALEHLSRDLARSSEELSSASTEQAASLQETVSTIDEIQSMVQKNAKSCEVSSTKAEEANSAARTGKKKVDDMTASINGISRSTDEIINEVENNNAEISKIVDLISEIENKTKVINDIVFQTKLLSFNASVEAARAGEHGKGFAVVAEEVGNLATMSGNAANEITTLLETSTQKVKDIVETSKQKVASIVKSTKDRVEKGTETASMCTESLETILQNTTSVSEMIKEITIAGNEQSTGIAETTVAMRQLDDVSHSNSLSAQNISNSAQQIRSSFVSLESAITNLVKVVEGKNTDAQVRKSESPIIKNEPVNNVVQFENEKGSEAEKDEGASLPAKTLKVSGLDTEVPLSSDPRFEDL